MDSNRTSALLAAARDLIGVNPGAVAATWAVLGPIGVAIDQVDLTHGALFFNSLISLVAGSRCR